MIEYLQKLRGNSNDGLTNKEKLELEHLRTQLQRYKEIEKQENQEIEVSEGSDSRSGSDNE